MCGKDPVYGPFSKLKTYMKKFITHCHTPTLFKTIILLETFLLLTFHTKMHVPYSVDNYIVESKIWQVAGTCLEKNLIRFEGVALISKISKYAIFPELTKILGMYESSSLFSYLIVHVP